MTDVRGAADFSTGDKFFEVAVNLRPGLLCELLTNCKQVKAKQLFLWFSDRHGHAWRKELKTMGIDFGRGKRMLVEGGAFDATYQIPVPKQMVKKNEKPYSDQVRLLVNLLPIVGKQTCFAIFIVAFGGKCWSANSCGV